MLSCIVLFEEVFDVCLFDCNMCLVMFMLVGWCMLVYVEWIVWFDGEMWCDIDVVSDVGLIWIGVIELIVYSWFFVLMV